MSIVPLHSNVAAFLKDAPKKMVINGERVNSLSGESIVFDNFIEFINNGCCLVNPPALWQE